jgi:crotonobetainyl-CoA:carnitine CoA-transferase CaiB-like acyl-CoA transferase
MRPLDGIRVVEMANVITGPFTGMVLADLGADVVKVEMPGVGDNFRQWAGDDDQFNPPFAAFNRGKRSVAIDVRTDEGAERYLRLTATADVVVENFRPGTLDRLGVGYDAVRAGNPGVVYCAISGMGVTGPDSGRPTYDAIAQALSGLWSQLTDLDAPEPVGPPMADQLGGLYAAQGVLAALLHRERTGEGQRVDVSMLEAALGFQTIAIAGHTMQGAPADKSSRARRSQTYAFVARDGRPFAIHLSTPDKFWRGLAEVAGRPDLVTDPRFARKGDRIAHYDELRAELAGVFAQGDRQTWLDELRERDVPAAPINTIAEALDEPQVRHLDVLRTFGEGAEALRLMGSPVRYSSCPPQDGLRPPWVGEHTDEVMREVERPAGTAHGG